MRLFIAIDISINLKKEILDLQSKITFGRIISVSKDNLHITLKFLGEVKDSKDIISKLENIDFQSFSISADKVGFFPNENFINVVWVGFEDSKKLIKLQQKVEEVLPDFKKDYNFVPHVTIARVKYLSSEERDKLKKIKSKSITKKSFNISSFKLIKSVLTIDGLVYEVMKEFKAKLYK